MFWFQNKKPGSKTLSKKPGIDLQAQTRNTNALSEDLAVRFPNLISAVKEEDCDDLKSDGGDTPNDSAGMKSSF